MNKDQAIDVPSYVVEKSQKSLKKTLEKHFFGDKKIFSIVIAILLVVIIVNGMVFYFTYRNQAKKVIVDIDVDMKKYANDAKLYNEKFENSTIVVDNSQNHSETLKNSLDETKAALNKLTELVLNLSTSYKDFEKLLANFDNSLKKGTDESKRLLETEIGESKDNTKMTTIQTSAPMKTDQNKEEDLETLAKNSAEAYYELKTQLKELEQFMDSA